MNAEQASKRVMWEPTRLDFGEGRRCWGRRATGAPSSPTGVMAMACMYMGNRRNTGSPIGRLGGVPGELVSREGQAGPDGVADGVVVLLKPGNAGGGKDPWSETCAGSSERGGD